MNNAAFKGKINTQQVYFVILLSMDPKYSLWKKNMVNHHSWKVKILTYPGLWIRIRIKVSWRIRIRIQEGKNDPQI
jgi:hypothetical protein